MPAAAKKLQMQDVDCSRCNIAGVSNLCKGSEESLRLIDEQKISFKLNKGEALNLSKGKSKSLFLIRDGALKLHTEVDSTPSIEILYKGSFLGGFDYIDSGSINVYAEAACDSELCEITEDVLQSLLRMNSHFIKRYLFFLSIYVSSLKRAKIESQSKNIVILLAKALQRDFKERGYTYKGKLTTTKILSQNEWALLFGARRESVSRAFKELEKCGAIKCNAGSISLIDETALIRLLLNKNN